MHTANELESYSIQLDVKSYSNFDEIKLMDNTFSALYESSRSNTKNAADRYFSHLKLFGGLVTLKLYVGKIFFTRLLHICGNNIRELCESSRSNKRPKSNKLV